MKTLAFVLGILFFILAALFLSQAFNPKYVFPTPMILFLSSIGIFMGSVIIMLLASILSHLQTKDK